MLISELSHFNPDFEIIEASEVIDYGIRAVICHKFNDGKIKAVTHVSRTIITIIVSKKNYG